MYFYFVLFLLLVLPFHHINDNQKSTIFEKFKVLPTGWPAKMVSQM
jgi:hypothetical protein